MTLDDRLANWGECERARLNLDHQAASIEGAYRSPQRLHWDSDYHVGTAPISLPPLDHADAREIELAVCAIDVFHHALLAAWFVRRYTAAGCLIAARTTARWPQEQQTRDDAAREFAARLLLAKALVQQELGLPAVVRRERARTLVRKVLRLEPLTPPALVPTIPLTI